MYAIFGFSHTSPSVVMDRLSVWSKEAGYKMAVITQNSAASVEEFADKYQKYRILVVPSVALLQKFRDPISNGHHILFLFDSNMNMAMVSNVTPMDYTDPEDGHGFNYRLKPVDFKSLRTSLKLLMEQRSRKVLKTQTIKHLPVVLNFVESGVLVNTISDFFYTATSHSNFAVVRKLVLTCLRKRLSAEKTARRIAEKVGARGYAAKLIEQLAEAMASESAGRLMKAVLDVEAKKASRVEGSKTKPGVNFKAIAKKHNVNPTELKHLVRLFVEQDKIVAPNHNVSLISLIG